ncbi:hypothetical protein BV898_16229 [Hypsibius exemplaris]|uniref:Antistasin-like domain-containing protein n=1 Tax=Hypsibius exemplaris TaxID=2072580 RepID=A0A9X6NLK6_HYPEX|nr:hypothetical protein BV898_16229 [Hypsibius exemplaris]
MQQQVSVVFLAVVMASAIVAFNEVSGNPALTKTAVGCPLYMCDMFCENGFEVDGNGCEICSCREEPVGCPPYMCMMMCEHGFETDANGCEVCSCRSDPITTPPAPTCSPFFMHLHCGIVCLYGYEIPENHRCVLCSCKPKPSVTRPPLPGPTRGA